MTTRRQFLSFLAPLAVLPVVGPHMLLTDRPKSLGWRNTLPGAEEGYRITFRHPNGWTQEIVKVRWRDEHVEWYHYS